MFVWQDIAVAEVTWLILGMLLTQTCWLTRQQFFANPLADSSLKFERTQVILHSQQADLFSMSRSRSLGRPANAGYKHPLALTGIKNNKLNRHTEDG